MVEHFASCQSWRLPSRYNLRAGLYGISWEHFTKGCGDISGLAVRTTQMTLSITRRCTH